MSNVSTIETKRESIGVGTIVTLKTGGPSMVVSERTAEKFHCHWHMENGEILEAWLPANVLKVKP
jgi:uncharacterized protein YodC (DUF2158 family)